MTSKSVLLILWPTNFLGNSRNRFSAEERGRKIYSSRGSKRLAYFWCQVVKCDQIFADKSMVFCSCRVDPAKPLRRMHRVYQISKNTKFHRALILHSYYWYILAIPMMRFWHKEPKLFRFFSLWPFWWDSEKHTGCVMQHWIQRILVFQIAFLSSLKIPCEFSNEITLLIFIWWAMKMNGLLKR